MEKVEVQCHGARRAEPDAYDRRKCTRSKVPFTLCRQRRERALVAASVSQLIEISTPRPIHQLHSFGRWEIAVFGRRDTQRRGVSRRAV